VEISVMEIRGILRGFKLAGQRLSIIAIIIRDRSGHIERGRKGAHCNWNN